VIELLCPVCKTVGCSGPVPTSTDTDRSRISEQAAREIALMAYGLTALPGDEKH
jgi:hypothetical protein